MTEVEFIAFSEGKWLVIPLMHLLKEFHSCGIDMALCKPVVHYPVFKDNNGVLELARTAEILTKDQAYIYQILTLQGVCGKQASEYIANWHQGSTSSYFYQVISKQRFQQTARLPHGQLRITIFTILNNKWGSVIYSQICEQTFLMSLCSRLIHTTLHTVKYKLHSAIYIILFTVPLTKRLHDHCY